MRVLNRGGNAYRLPNHLSAFQEQMYIHLIDWKWKHITTERGKFRDLEYDTILPERFADDFRVLYPAIVQAMCSHRERFPFHVHEFFGHMSSSQAANINLFLPILLHRHAPAILARLKPDFARLATDYLDHGFRIEFWDEPHGSLGDKTDVSGTDADIAIAYYNLDDTLCLWLIEHKLTEPEFTTCGAFKSKGRTARHDCRKPFSELVENLSACYYHDVKKFNYWKITAANRDFFWNIAPDTGCPFRGGMNQLWRNQLLALAIEQDVRQPYEKTTFSVVHHPRNTALDATITAYRNLIGDTPKFTTFTSAEVIAAANDGADDGLRAWITWYKDLYDI